MTGEIFFTLSIFMLSTMKNLDTVNIHHDLQRKQKMQSVLSVKIISRIKYCLVLISSNLEVRMCLFFFGESYQGFQDYILG